VLNRAALVGALYACRNPSIVMLLGSSPPWGIPEMGSAETAGSVEGQLPKAV
jgi:hypothetical protein